MPGNQTEQRRLHFPSVLTLLLKLIIVVASHCSSLNWLTTCYGCLSLFLSPTDVCQLSPPAQKEISNESEMSRAEQRKVATDSEV